MSFFLNYVVVSKIKHVAGNYEQIFSFPIVLVFDLSSHEKEEKKLQNWFRIAFLNQFTCLTFKIAKQFNINCALTF